jgi:hypothetical protein
MSQMGQLHALPQCNSNGRFTSMSGLGSIGGPLKWCCRGLSLRRWHSSRPAWPHRMHLSDSVVLSPPSPRRARCSVSGERGGRASRERL